MTPENYTKLALLFIGLTGGALFGVLRSKIFSSKQSTGLHITFYILSGLPILIGVLGCIIFGKTLCTFETISFIIAILVGTALIIVTRKFLIVKDIFSTPELNPIVNNFTANADLQEIKLFGGDLNFLGNSPAQIDQNVQYTHLRAMGFTRVLILCEAPHDNIQRIRYGKLLMELPGTQLRFYQPRSADLRVRGRIIQTSGVNKLLMYTKISSGRYQTIETDLGSSNGALYNNIWELAWSLADIPDADTIATLQNLFIGGH